MAALKFASLHNMVAFLDKPTKSDGFEQIVDFLNAHSIKYTLTVNPTIYTSCIEQFWTTAKVKTVNEEVQIQALVDKKKVIVTKTSVRSDLQLEDAEGTECLPNTIIFEQLTLMGYENITQKLTFYKAFFSPQWKFFIHTIIQCLSAKTTAWNEFSSTITSAVILLLNKQVEGMAKHKKIYVTPSHTKKVFARGREKTFLKKQSRRKQRKDTEVSQSSDPTEPMADETENVESVPTHSNDPLLSALKIDSLKRRVKKLEKKKGSRTHRLRRLFKVGRSAQVVSSEDEGLGAQEDTSKQGRKIVDLDADAEVTLVDEAQGRNDDNLMFDTGVLDEQEVEVEKVVSTAEVTTASATTTTVDELTLAQTLIEIKAAKPKAVTTAATTTTTAVTRPKARGVVVQEPSEFRTTTSSSQTSQLPQAKDKGKAKMIEPEKPLKKKDQILIDEEIAQKLQAQLNAELEEEEKLAKQKEKDANIIEWDNVQAMIDADYELVVRLQAQEQE
ncbi:hypothetical protein Tco_1300017 [Tanacetum coccineum]